MKTITSLSILFLVLLLSCGNQENKIANIELSQLMNDINWYNDYSNVKDLLEKKYKLEYERKVNQKEEGISIYVFSGITINSIKTTNCSIVFNNDSLNSIVFTIKEDSKNPLSADLEKLKSAISNLPIEQYYKESEFWIVRDDQDELNGIQLSSNSKTILISISSEKYINKYSSI